MNKKVLKYSTIGIISLVTATFALGVGNPIREIGSSIVNFNEVTSTPANPDANNYKVYFKTDGNFYKLNSSGAESAIGGTGAGADLTFTQYTANATVSVTDGVILSNGSNTGGFNLTLPSAAANSGKQLYFKNITDGQSIINILAAGSDKIDGGSIITFSERHHEAHIASDGTKWRKLNHHLGTKVLGATVNCDGSSCTVQSEFGEDWITSVGRGGVGIYAITANSGIFDDSQAACACSADNDGGGQQDELCTLGMTTATAMEIYIFDGTTPEDSKWRIICMDDYD